MRNTRSTNKEKSVNTFHFAVHPIAAQFDKQYTHNYYLYLQKNQQILGRYELSPKTIYKSTRYYFQVPTAIQHFRIISDLNLEFRWSLYMQKVRDNYREQEYMQGKKINLKWCWQNYLQHQENVHWLQVLFGEVKLKFYFLFVVGQTHQAILQAIQDYYRKNAIKPTKLMEINTNIKTIESEIVQMSSLQKIAQLSYKISETVPFLLQNQSLVQEMKSRDGQNNKWTPAKIVSNINSLEEKGFQCYQVQSFIQGQASPSKQTSPIASKSLENLKLKLTVSELQISKDIERKIKQSYQEASKIAVEENFQIQSKAEIKPLIINQNSLEKNLQITESQYLNQRNEMIVSPFYRHFKYWIIIIAIVIIFGTLVHLGPKKHEVKVYNDQPTNIHEDESHKNKIPKQNKKKANKKNKKKSERRKRKSNRKVVSKK